MTFPEYTPLDDTNAELSIVRGGDHGFRIRIIDRDSGVTVVEAAMDASTFANALTGLSNVPVRATYSKRLDAVGKIKVVEPRSAECPLLVHDNKEKLTAWLLENCAEDGWEINAYLGSQRSIAPSRKNARGCVLNYSVYTYVKKED